MIKLALVGIGDWASRIADQIIRCKSVNLYKVFTRTKTTREKFAKKYNSRAAESYHEILLDPEVDGIILETPNFIHKEQIIEAAEHNKPVFVDKPICNYIENAKEAIKVCNSRNNILMVGHCNRKRPDSRKMKEIIDSGEIGEIVVIDSVISSPRGFDLKPKEWRWSNNKCPGGPLIQLGIHNFDTLSYLNGPIEQVNSFQSHLKIPAEIVDTTATIVKFSNGSLGYINSCYNTTLTYCINIYGTEGKITFDALDGLRVFDLKGNKEKIELGTDDPNEEAILAEVEEFAECIKNNSRPEVGGEEALRALAVVSAAISSQKNNKSVMIKEVLENN